MKSKVSQVLFSFITGASLSHTGDAIKELERNDVVMIQEADPEAYAEKLTPAQAKDVLELKAKGVDAYVITVKNPSRRSYSVTAASIDAPVYTFAQSKKALSKSWFSPLGTILGAVGNFSAPVGVIGNIISFAKMKSAKIFEGKLNAMLLDKEVVNSYGQLSRVVLVKSGQELKNVKIELIDIQSLGTKKIELS